MGHMSDTRAPDPDKRHAGLPRDYPDQQAAAETEREADDSQAPADGKEEAPAPEEPTD